MPVTDIRNAILKFDKAAIQGLVKHELDQGTKPETVLAEGLIAAMDQVGELFSQGELFFPEMLMAAKVMKIGLEEIKPLLVAEQTASEGTVVLGTVKGDLHDIGKNLVSMMLEGAGFNVIDLGVDVESAAFVEAARANQAGMVGLSALLTTTMPAMAATVAALKASDPPFRVMVGGAPVSQSFADEIGADAYGEDAPSAVRMARELMAV